jgi:bifunctional DNA-binding transcriptional regulator/antitoxin component of YhaV-PrlF toxin-antitoxin module
MFLRQRMVVKQKNRRTGKSGKTSGISEPLAGYGTDTGPVITIDATGRMVLPKKIRDRFGSNCFRVRETRGHIELIPVKPLSSLLGILPDIDLEAVYRDHDRDVEEEDADDRSRYPR